MVLETIKTKIKELRHSGDFFLVSSIKAMVRDKKEASLQQRSNHKTSIDLQRWIAVQGASSDYKNRIFKNAIAMRLLG